MRCRSLPWLLFGWLLTLAFQPAPVAAQFSKPKNILNLDGGLMLLTDGAITHGLCFRLNGRLDADGFFEDLRRVDSPTATIYRRGHDVVTEFPEKMHLSLRMTDFPCPEQLKKVGPRLYLTHSVVNSLRLSFYWKRGVELRPAMDVVLQKTEARPLQTYVDRDATDLPAKYEWNFEFEVPSAGVPVTDSLVIVVRTPDDRIAAKVAARM